MLSQSRCLTHHCRWLPNLLSDCAKSIGKTSTLPLSLAIDSSETTTMALGGVESALPAPPKHRPPPPATPPPPLMHARRRLPGTSPPGKVQLPPPPPLEPPPFGERSGGELEAWRAQHPLALVLRRLAASGGDGEPCAVCLEPPEEPVELPCRHSYCARCISALRERRVNQVLFIGEDRERRGF